jgi:hypothetical protein
VLALALLAALPAGAAAKLSREPQKVYDDYRSDAAIQPCDHTVAVYRRTLREIDPTIEEDSPAFRPAVEAALREREHGRHNCLEQDSPSQPGSGGSATGGSSGGSAGGSVAPARPALPSTAPVKPKPAPPVAAAPAPAPGSAAPAPSATPAPAAPAPAAPAPPATSSVPAPPADPVLVDHPHKGTPMGLAIALGLLALAAMLGLLALAARRFGWGEVRLAGPRHAWGEAAYRASATWADFVDWIRLGRGPHRL